MGRDAAGKVVAGGMRSKDGERDCGDVSGDGGEGEKRGRPLRSGGGGVTTGRGGTCMRSPLSAPSAAASTTNRTSKAPPPCSTPNNRVRQLEKQKEKAAPRQAARLVAAERNARSRRGNGGLGDVAACRRRRSRPSPWALVDRR